MVEQGRLALKRHGAAVGGLLLAALGVYGHLLVPGRIPLSAHSDILPAHLATKQVLYEGLLSGALPLWRSDLMLGAPAISDPQALFLHPLHVLFWWLPPPDAFGPTLLLGLFVAGLGGYALARTLGCAGRAAFLGGLGQLVSFKLIAAGYAGWSSVLPMLCLLPAVAAAILRLFQRPGPGSALVLAGCLLFALSGGSPQTLYYLLLWLVPCGLVPGLSRALPHLSGIATVFGQLKRTLPYLLAAALCGILGTAYLWVSVVLELPLLSRVGQNYDFFLSGHSLSVAHLATLLRPEALGTPLDGSYAGVELWEDVAYFGVIPLLGALSALVRVRRLPVVARYVAAAFVGSLLLSFAPALQRFLFDFMPGYGLFRLPARMLFVTAVFGITLFALTADSVLRRSPLRWGWLLFGLCALAMGLEGRVYAARYLATVNVSELVLPEEHPINELDADVGRLAIIFRSSFNYGSAKGAGVRLLNGYNPYNFESFKRYLDIANHGSWRERPASNWFDLQRVNRPDLVREAGVSHVLCSAPLQSPGLTPVGTPRTVRNFVLYRGFSRELLYTYRLSNSRPLARFATHVVPVDSAVTMADRMEATKLTGQAIVLMPGAATKNYGLGTDGRNASAIEKSRRLRVVSADAGSIILETHSRAPEWLVVAEAFHPGWTAHVDGQALRPVQTNLALLGLPLAPGEHRVELTFSPLGWSWSWPLSLGAWLFWLLLCVYYMARGRTVNLA